MDENNLRPLNAATGLEKRGTFKDIRRGQHIKVVTEGERMWWRVESVDGDLIRATCANTPTNTSRHGYKYGDAEVFSHAVVIDVHDENGPDKAEG